MESHMYGPRKLLRPLRRKMEMGMAVELSLCPSAVCIVISRPTVFGRCILARLGFCTHVHQVFGEIKRAYRIPLLASSRKEVFEIVWGSFLRVHTRTHTTLTSYTRVRVHTHGREKIGESALPLNARTHVFIAM
jgi:hypothetical protein